MGTQEDKGSLPWKERGHGVSGVGASIYWGVVILLVWTGWYVLLLGWLMVVEHISSVVIVENGRTAKVMLWCCVSAVLDSSLTFGMYPCHCHYRSSPTKLDTKPLDMTHLLPQVGLAETYINLFSTASFSFLFPSSSQHFPSSALRRHLQASRGTWCLG